MLVWLAERLQTMTHGCDGDVQMELQYHSKATVLQHQWVGFPYFELISGTSTCVRRMNRIRPWHRYGERRIGQRQSPYLGAAAKVAALES